MINRLSLFPVILLAASPLCRAVGTPAAEAPATLAPAIAPASTGAPTEASPQTISYTVAKGESIWDLSHKFHCSVTAIKKANGLKKTRLKTGQVLEIPSAGAPKTVLTASTDKKHKDKKSSAKTATTPVKSKHHYLAAQPVQDFDVAPSTFASCPTPPESEVAAPETPEVVAPVATEHMAPSVEENPAPLAEAPTAESLNKLTNHRGVISSSTSASQSYAPSGAAHETASVPAAPSLQPAPAHKTLASALSSFFGGAHSEASESGEWGNKFMLETRNLAARGIAYDQSWRPEGESHSWAMDCSNTSRYLYQVTAGIQLPRTASDQYYYLHLQNKAWDVPTTSTGFADCNYLRSNLKPGDLLFWENTYRPERQPPITHVMIFLGTNAQGKWIMAGSQSGRGGFYSPRRSGPDVYVFDPTHTSGGYTTWMGLVRHKGRFCAYGRPLEADQKKLSVAAND